VRFHAIELLPVACHIAILQRQVTMHVAETGEAVETYNELAERGPGC
jgi:hypothetical protein